jgi:phytol kinase
MPGFLWSGLYFGSLLLAAETARRRFRAAPDATRKAVLAGIGAWSVPAVFLFGEPRAAALAFLLLALALYLSFRYEILRAVEDEGAGFGSVLAPLSAAALIGWFLPSSPEIAVASILAMSLGDSAAALVGRRRGTRRYRFLGHSRTMEGTLALFLVSSAAQAAALAAMGGVDWHQAVAFALIAGTVAASVESISVYGTDNVTVPISAASTLAALSSASALQ